MAKVSRRIDDRSVQILCPRKIRKKLTANTVKSQFRRFSNLDILATLFWRGKDNNKQVGNNDNKMSNRRFSQPLWHLIDAKNQIVGRLAPQIATILRGKHKPSFTPNYDCGDYVVIINAKDVKFTGDKLLQKKYIWHTGFPGGIKERTVKEQLQHKPEEVFIIFFQFSLSINLID